VSITRISKVNGQFDCSSNCHNSGKGLCLNADVIGEFIVKNHNSDNLAPTLSANLHALAADNGAGKS